MTARHHDPSDETNEALSDQVLLDFSRRVRAAAMRAAALGMPEEHASQRTFAAVTTTELFTVLEELQVAEEELRVQAEALVSARNQLERERARYRELFEFAPDAYIETDDDRGVILEANVADAPSRGLPGGWRSSSGRTSPCAASSRVMAGAPAPQPVPDRRVPPPRERRPGQRGAARADWYSGRTATPGRRWSSCNRSSSSWLGPPPAPPRV